MITLYINSRRLKILLGLITHKPRLTSQHLSPIQLYEQKLHLSISLDLPPQITVNKQWILGTHAVSYAKLVIMVMLHLGRVALPAGQSRLLSIEV